MTSLQSLPGGARPDSTGGRSYRDPLSGGRVSHPRGGLTTIWRRRGAATQYIEAVGGKLHGFWYAFGDHDAYCLWEAPDNVAMAATAVGISAGGALNELHTTVLLSVEETLAALKKASTISYRAPGS